MPTERIRELEKELQVFRLAGAQLPKEPRNFNRVNQVEGEPRSGMQSYRVRVNLRYLEKAGAFILWGNESGIFDIAIFSGERRNLYYTIHTSAELLALTLM